MKPDPKFFASYYGCAHELKKDDKRHAELTQQRKEWGFDDTETWSLATTFAEFILPRLKRYRDINQGKAGKSIYITLEKEFAANLDSTIEAFELMIEDLHPRDEEKQKKIELGLKAFAERYQELWW